MLLAIGLAGQVAGQVKEPVKLSGQATIGLVTCNPSEGAVFLVYGHTAIRVQDPAQGIDVAFNYGIFNFDGPGFVYRFTKGETDYRLAITGLDYLVWESSMMGRGVREQVLNLTAAEKQALWDALVWNAQPQNATYRYNFFFDNCATRPAAIIEKHIGGKVVYRHTSTPQTFRQLINYCMRNKPWAIFGTELALGSPTDRLATSREEFFLPLYLEKAFDKAVIINPDGSERPLVLQTGVLLEDAPQEIGETWLTPLLCSLLLLAAILFATFWERRRKVYCRWADYFLFAAAGLSGCLIFFLAFVSEHPATWPNWVIFWLHPFHLVGVWLFAVKKWKKAATVYHFLNLLLLTGLLAGWYFIPQHFNPAFLPLIAALWIRSLFSITNYGLRITK
ncbi:membrane protein [Bacteroidia bacterium]|nr:membrane protein [Bacteroidia bacterium]